MVDMVAMVLKVNGLLLVNLAINNKDTLALLPMVNNKAMVAHLLLVLMVNLLVVLMVNLVVNMLNLNIKLVVLVCFHLCSYDLYIFFSFSAGYQPYGAGYGQRLVAPAEIQAQYRGKPAFYDASRGILYDGKTAWYYAPHTPYGQTSSVITAIETTPSGATRITVGNGTSGNLQEHQAHQPSNYAYEAAGYAW